MKAEQAAKLPAPTPAPTPTPTPPSTEHCYWYRKIGLTTDVFPYTVVPGIAFFLRGTPGPPPAPPGFELVGVVGPEHPNCAAFLQSP